MSADPAPAPVDGEEHVDGGSEDSEDEDGRYPRWPLSGVVLAVLWLFVRGVDLTLVRLVEEFIIGLLVGMTVSFAVRRFYAPTTPVARTVGVAPYAGLYLAAFLKELAVANVDVARRVLSPSMPIHPAVVELPLRVRTDAAITTIANSITLTPGTLTMDYDGDTNTLYVHSIDGSDLDAVVDPIRTWEDYALVIFDEDLKPGDPVPRPARVDGGRIERSDRDSAERSGRGPADRSSEPVGLPDDPADDDGGARDGR